MPKRRFRNESQVPYVVGEGKLAADVAPRALRKPYPGPKPVRRSSTFEAKFPATCFVCTLRVKKGDLVCRARFPNGQDRWVHAGCCRDTEEN